MSQSERTFVGFGFGAIQAGLLLYEAAKSGNFGRLVVGEIVPEVVEAVTRAGRRFSVNIALPDHVESAQVCPVELVHTGSPAGQAILADAVADASEIATAVPSVQQYLSGAAGSLRRILADGLRRKAAANGPRAVVYAAENHNCAAEILRDAVLEAIPEAERAAVRARVRFVNTVIGKMSGVVSGEEELRSRGLVPMTPGAGRAFLVESFNRILVGRIQFGEGGPAFRRGIEIFEEEPDLLPFEEAKLHGHNATHALAAYLAAVRGMERMCEVAGDRDLMTYVRAAFLDESGSTLIRRHSGVDPLFTVEGYRAYAEDLLARMFNPHLGDRVIRVARDPRRKLGWDDRLVGTIRLALAQGVNPRRYAAGAAAALAAIEPAVLREERVSLSALLVPLWSDDSPDAAEAQPVLLVIEEGRACLKRWVERGFPDLESVTACC